MDTIRDAITQLSQEFKETKEKLAKKDEELVAKITEIYEKECDLAEAKRQLAEKNKRLEEMAAKIQKLEEQMENPELHFVAKLNTYKEEMSRGIFSKSFDSFYRELDKIKKTTVEKVLNPIIFHKRLSSIDRSIFYKKFTCFTDGIRLYDNADHSIEKWEYQNPIIHIPKEMVTILKNSVALYLELGCMQNALIFINTDSNSNVKMRFVNSVNVFSINIEDGNVFDDISELEKMFHLRQIADKHNEQTIEILKKAHENFLEDTKTIQYLSAQSKENTQAKDDDEFSKTQIPKASEVASEVH